MQRQAATLLASAAVAVGLFFGGMQLPTPYVRLVPGPVTNTLGKAPKGNPVISIVGHATSPTTGRLYLVTVSEYGGPGQNLPAFDVLAGWWNKSDAVVPVHLLYGPTTTQQEAAEEDAAQMDQSQEDAKIAALRYLNFDLTPGAVVSTIQDDSTAKDELKPGDAIVAVDSTPITNIQQLSDATKAHQPGDHITLTVDRNGNTLDVPVTLLPPASGGSGPRIGIGVVNGYALPFEIDINLPGVGGPSAGMMFTLGIIDKLDGGDLTGGMIIAGTGTISADGTVGAIGGIQQKMAAARSNGATVFLAPKANCAEALKAVPKGLRLVKVETLKDAVSSIKKVRDHESGVPSCSSS